MKRISYDKIDNALYINFGYKILFGRVFFKALKSEGYCFVNYDLLGDKLMEIRILDASDHFSTGFLDLLKKRSLKSWIIGIYSVRFSDSIREKMVTELKDRYPKMDTDIKKEFEHLVSVIGT